MPADLFDEIDVQQGIWFRRIYWVWACKPPWWRPFKRRKWAQLKAKIDAPLDNLYKPHYRTQS